MAKQKLADLMTGVDASMSDWQQETDGGWGGLILQWNGGNQTLAKKGIDGSDGTGGWFISDSTIDDDIKDEFMSAAMEVGFVEDTFTLDDGEELHGLYAPSVEMSVLLRRRRWASKNGDGNSFAPFGYKGFEALKEAGGKPTSKMQHIVLIKGLTQFGPMLVTMNGFGRSKAFDDDKTTSACGLFRSTVVKQATAATGSKGQLPQGRFWMSVGLKHDEDGKVIFEKVGKGDKSSTLSLPGLLNVDASDDELDVMAYALDADDWTIAQPLFEEFTEWKNAWNSFDAVDATESVSEDTAEDDGDAADAELAAAGMS